MCQPKLSIPKQIEDLKKRGIAFELMSEADAKRFLENNNYYFKLKAYAHNFQRYEKPEKAKMYINLDFAHLVDLSTIDARFRKIILNLAIDLEHFLKVKMLSDFNKSSEDGYEIITEFFHRDPNRETKLAQKSNTSTCGAIVQKFQGKWAIWNIIELISFGDFIELYSLFYERNPGFENYDRFLFSIRMIRNAAAHNNCLINQLKAPYSRTVNAIYDLKAFIKNDVGILGKTVDKQLQHPTVHDFLALLYVYNQVVPEPSRGHGMEAVRELFDERIPRNRAYYSKHQGLLVCYNFVHTVVKYFC